MDKVFRSSYFGGHYDPDYGYTLLNDRFFKDNYKEVEQKINWSYRDWEISITPKAYKKMYYYTKAAHGEISGFGKVVMKRKKFIILGILSQ